MQGLRKHYKSHAYSDNSLSRQICQRTWMMLTYWLQHYFHVDFADVGCPTSLPEASEESALAEYPWLSALSEYGGVSGMIRLTVDFISDVSASPLQNYAKKISEALQVRCWEGRERVGSREKGAGFCVRGPEQISAARRGPAAHWRPRPATGRHNALRERPETRRLSFCQGAELRAHAAVQRVGACCAPRVSRFRQVSEVGGGKKRARASYSVRARLCCDFAGQLTHY